VIHYVRVNKDIKPRFFVKNRSHIAIHRLVFSFILHCCIEKIFKMSSAAVLTTVAIASAIVLYALKKMVSHRLRAMTYRNHVAPFSAAASQEQDDVPDAAIPDDNTSPSVMQTCCPLLPLSREPWKPTLVLDLDETLVHAVPAVKPMFPAELLKVSQDDGDFALWLAIRPHVHQFLSSLAAHYELVVWTAGTEPYGRAVVQRLDPSGSFISYSLYRQHCTQQDGRFIKDLNRLARENVRICDNNPVSYSFQPTKGIPVNDFLGDPQDMELVKLLRELSPIDDVEMLDVEHIPFSGEDAEIIDADSFGLEEPSSVKFNELDPVGVVVCNGQFELPCVTNTAFSTVFEEQGLPKESVVQGAFTNVRQFKLLDRRHALHLLFHISFTACFRIRKISSLTSLITF
jgi:Dullard-like phosphatase family protein